MALILGFQPITQTFAPRTPAPLRKQLSRMSALARVSYGRHVSGEGANVEYRRHARPPACVARQACEHSIVDCRAQSQQQDIHKTERLDWQHVTLLVFSSTYVSLSRVASQIQRDVSGYLPGIDNYDPRRPVHTLPFISILQPHRTCRLDLFEQVHLSSTSFVNAILERINQYLPVSSYSICLGL